MELWNLYDSNMQLEKTGHSSEEPIPDGLYHLTVEVWPFDGQRFFLTRRSLSKTTFPGYWECTGGSAIGEESFWKAAAREVEEELGINIEDNCLFTLGQELKDHHIVMVFLLTISSDQIFVLNPKEITEGRWFSIQQMESLHLDLDFVPFQYKRYLKYVRKKAYDSYITDKPDSIKRLIDKHAELCFPKRGLPNSGSRPDGKPFSDRLNSIHEAFLIYGDPLYTQDTLLSERVNNSLGTGSPLNVKPFPPVVESIDKALNTDICSQYPFPAGDMASRKTVCEYLIREGFSKKLTPENIIFTMSTTHAFDMVLRLIMQPGDAVIFTAPTYGLFAFVPERLGGETRFIDLRQKDNWLINPDRLEQYIIEQNNILKTNSKDKNKPSRVVAFFHENPHNPTGKVIGLKERKLLKQVAEVCRRHSVLLIDDLLYRDLCYDRENMALPAASFDEEYQNTISLIGLSKSYGLAGIRAGAIIADEIIVRGIRDMIFQEIDSASYLNAIALSAAFCTSPKRDLAYNYYFSDVLDRYQFNYSLIVAAVDGIDAVDNKYRKQVYSFVSNVLNDKSLIEWWLAGMDQVHFIPGLKPESGFFCILDFSELRGKSIDGIEVDDDISLLLYLFRRYRINFITGKSMGWPNKEQIVARLSYSVNPSKIVTVLRYMKEEINQLS